MATKKTPEAPKPEAPQYRLVELRAKNIKKLHAVSIDVAGSPLFKISGRNEQGKSSVLDAVAMAIAGPAAFPEKPIREGQDKAEIFLDFAGLTISRRIWRKDGATGYGQDVTIEFADGRRPKDKQTVLDALRGSPIADDPIEFARLKPKERYDLLKKLVPGYDFEAKQKEWKELFDERTATGRLRDRAVAAAAAAVVPANAPAQAVDVSALMQQLQEAMDANAKIDKRAANREDAADELDRWRDEADQMAAALKLLNEKIADREQQIAKAEPLPEKVDAGAIEQQVRDAAALNEAFNLRQRRKELQAEADRLVEEYERQSLLIAGLNEEKERVIENAKLPVPELTFGDGDILLDGLPFDQASTARKIRVSTALLMALKPDLRVLLVREGSLLDDDARAALEADARANGFVVLMECVSEEVGAGGVVIENGEIV